MMLMGTAEEAMLKTVKAEDIPKFDEDMTDADRKKFLEDKGVVHIYIYSYINLLYSVLTTLYIYI